MIRIHEITHAPQGVAQTQRIGDLVKDPGVLLGVNASGTCLHYCAPTHGGWGVIRTAMLVPEMYMLFVCPAACGRHGAIAAIEQGCKDRVGYLCLDEHEIVLGSYEDEIRKTVPALMAQLTPRPRAFIIVVSCIDDLLGTDYSDMLAGFESQFGMPFRLGRMNPISLAGKLPPGKRIQRDMYDFLEKDGRAERSIGLIGPFQSLAAETELRTLLRDAGYGPIRHISECHSYDEFQQMGAACLNLVTRPEGLDAAMNLQEKLGTPFVLVPTAFSEESIRLRYEKIGEALGVRLDYADALAAMRRSAQTTLEIVGQRSIAIDGTATCSPFDLARALCESGFNVKELVTENLPEFERASFEWLAANRPDIKVTSPIHHANSWIRPAVPTVDIAIGFTAAYFTAAPAVAAVSFDEGVYGCHGVSMVHRALQDAAAATEKPSLEVLVRDYGLVV